MMRSHQVEGAARLAHQTAPREVFNGQGEHIDSTAEGENLKALSVEYDQLGGVIRPLVGGLSVAVPGLPTMAMDPRTARVLLRRLRGGL